MKRFFGILILFSIFFASPAFAQAPNYIDGLYDGLENCIPYDLPEKMHAFELPEVDPDKHPGMAPPITDDTLNIQWFIDGSLANKMSSLEETRLYYDVFPNQEFVYLPPEAKILRSSENEAPVDWNYPDGMRFFHRIKIRKYAHEKEAFFELRMIKRIKGKWAFGIYSESFSGACGEGLELRKAPLDAVLNITAYRFDPWKLRMKKIEYRAKPLDPRSCIDCHGMGDEEQEGQPSKVGPCNYKFLETLQKNIKRPMFGKE